MRTFSLVRIVIAVIVVGVHSAAAAQIRLSPPLAANLSSPVFVGHAGDGSGRLFILEQAGIITVLPSDEAPTIFLDIRSRVLSGGERGLLGIAFHPLYGTNGRFFVFYTQNPDGALVVAEYRASPPDSDVAMTTERRILVIPHPGAANHNGGMLAFGGDGYLYVGVGDGGGANDPPNNAQNVNTLLGKILRIDINTTGTPYSSPPDNPFAGPAAGLDEIYAYGMRNPWRFSFDRQTDQLWVGDVGQGAREEVDTPIVSGGNYGWRVWEGMLCRETALCGSADYIPPLFDYAHSGGRCSLTGGYVYRGGQGAVPQGTYLYGDFCTGEILAWNGSSQSVLLGSGMSISSFGEDEQGELYVVDLGGTVSRIESSVSCQFSISPTSLTFPQQGGVGTVEVTAGVGCGWTAVSNEGWITVTGGTPGTGNKAVTFSVAPYTGKPRRRNGTITIGGETFNIRQSR